MRYLKAVYTLASYSYNLPVFYRAYLALGTRVHIQATTDTTAAIAC